MYRGRFKYKTALALLLAVLLLAGCGLAEERESAEPEPESTMPEITADVSPSAVSVVRNDRFSLRYDSKSSLNPITCTSSDNLLVTELMYESLFVLDDNFNAVPVLCESYSTDDNITFTFNIKSGISMSDGSHLTAGDVAYTLNAASEAGRFVNYLDVIESVEASAELEVTVRLKVENRRFPALLYVPIIKSGSLGSANPPGTGPFKVSDMQDMRLDAILGYRDYRSLPVQMVYLTECGDSELIEYFAEGRVSLVRDDPADIVETTLIRGFETRYYDTTTLQFIGLNTRSAAMSDSEVRRAIGHAVPREYITETIMPGRMLAAPLALPQSYRLYDTDWEPEQSDPIAQISAILQRIGLSDTDNDSYLEYPLSADAFQPFSIDFIVNSENIYKLRAAKKIADTLRRVGFDITVRELPWSEFLDALNTGDFDMYYGEAALGGDFNLSSLLLPGGRLSYGGTGSNDYRPLINDFMTADTEEAEREAAKALCAEIYTNAPFIPILYKRHAIYTCGGLVSDASPSMSTAFRSFADWTIHLR